MTNQGFFTIFRTLLSFITKMFTWAGSLYIYDDDASGGIVITILDVFIVFLVLSFIISFAHEAILKRKVNRNENV